MSIRSSLDSYSQHSESGHAPSVSNDAVEAPAEKVTKAKRPTSVIKWLSICFVVILFAVAAFFGGYMLRWYQGGGGSIQSDSSMNISWRDTSCTLSTATECGYGPRSSPSLLVISIGGFRPDFLSKQSTPALWNIQSCGVSAPSMRPVNPTTGFPNQYSIVTGLFPESHGIVDSTFRDAESNKLFNYRQGDASQQSDPAWWKGQPIWVTAKKQGKRAHVYHWVGSEVTIDSVRPDEFVVYDSTISLESRIDKILDWLSAASERKPDITLIYLEELDTTAHKFGLQSPELSLMLTKVDGAIDRLMQGLHSRKLLSCANIIITSDHGLENTACSKSIDVMSYLLKNIRNDSVSEMDFEFFGGSQGRLSVSKSSRISEQMTYNALACDAPDNQGAASRYTLYSKSQLPRRFHYANTPRVEPMVMTAVAGYRLYKTRIGNSIGCDGAGHGYDNLYKTMDTLFLAQGPSFKASYQTESFLNIELYNLMCELVGIEPAPNNGTAGSLHDVLRSPKKIQPLPKLITPRPAFPATEELVRSRQNAECSRECFSDIVEPIMDADMRLNISFSLAEKLLFSHTNAYGAPDATDTTQIELLVNSDFVLGYNQQLKTPAWAAFTLESAQKLNGASFVTSAACMRNDVRMNTGTTPDCTNYRYNSVFGETLFYRIYPAYLAAPALNLDPANRTDAKTITNVVPMYQSFRTEIWHPFWDMVINWAKLYGKLHIHVGPVFDNIPPFGFPDKSDDNFTFPVGLRNIPLPSHFFVIASKSNRNHLCTEEKCQAEVISFILPHKPELAQHPCQDKDSYFLTHSASVKDVETITGLRFFTSLPLYEAVRIKISQPTKLWHKTTGLN